MPANPTSRDLPALRLLLLIVMPVLIVAGGILGFRALARARKDPQRKPTTDMIPRVQTRTVEAGPRRLAVRGYGTAIYPRTVNLSAEVSGRVIWVAPGFRAGNQVEPGPVVRLDPKDYKLAIRQIEADLELARQTVEKFRQELANQASLKTLTERELALTRKDLEETRKLHRQGAASDQELRSLERAAVQRETSLQAIENRLKTIPIDIRQQQAAITQAEARLEQARKNLDRTEIDVPFAGRVVSEDVELGKVLQPGNPFATVGDDRSMEVPVSLSLDDLQYLPQGNTYAGVDFDAVDAVVHWSGNRQIGSAERQRVHSSWSGRVVRAESIDRRTRTVPIVVLVEQPRQPRPGSTGRPVLMEGMFCDVELQGVRVPHAAVVPRTAMQEDGTVYVAVPAPEGDGMVLDIRDITVAQADRDTVVVTEGLSDGDLLIVTPIAYPIRGMTLHIDTTGTTADPASPVDAQPRPGDTTP